MKNSVCPVCGRTFAYEDGFLARLVNSRGDVIHAMVCPGCIGIFEDENGDDDCECSYFDEPDDHEEKGYGYASDRIMTPMEIKAVLDEHIVGQDDAKKRIAVAVYNHYKRTAEKVFKDYPVEIAKSNVLLLGPTGSGKTLIAQTVAKLLDVPFAIADATSMTQAGYVGDDVETMLQKLYFAAGGDISRAEEGIIFVDEIDKLAKSSAGLSVTRDVSGEGVQQALLKILEGTKVRVNLEGSRKHPNGPMVEIDTTNILFFCGGAFVGLEDIVKKRTEQNTSIGFGGTLRKDSTEEDKLKLRRRVTPQDLNEYGMIPELIGRIPVVTTLEELSEDTLVRILTEPKNALVKQYQALMDMDRASLTFTDDALREIARMAKAEGTGARGLRSIMEDVMQDFMYNSPSEEKEDYVVTAEMVRAYTSERQAI